MKIMQILIVFVIISSSGCKGPTGLDGAIGSQLKGDIFGYVDIYDVNGKPVIDRHGVYIQTEENLIGSLSDTSGRWTLKDLYAGIYTISANKTGYTKASVSNFQFVGGGNAYFNSPLAIIELPSFSIKSISLTGNSTDSLGQQLAIDVNPPASNGDTRSFFIVYGKVPTVAINTPDALITSQATYTYKTVGSASISLKNVITNLKNNFGMQSGDRAYAVVYPSSAHISNVGTYTDPITRKVIFTRFSAPFVAVNFQIP
ncbi:MAG: hypothetical protein HYZ54_11780 [Ignavibacteriae bacterium]|nr:hypothetical protein [Ignavibacteriota bacterium]